MVKRAFLVGAILLLVSLLVLGCDSTKGGGAVDMMKKVPMSSDSFVFVDIDAFRTDTDLEETYWVLQGGFGVYADVVDIDFREVHSFAGGGRSFGDTIVLFEGDFSLDEAREKLEELDFDSAEYNGIEVWVAEGGLIALVSSKLVILGVEETVKDCIKVIKEGDASLYDDEDFRGVIERLPCGIFVTCEEGEGVLPITYYEYDGLKVKGISVRKKDECSVAYTMVSKFENSNAASDAMDEIRFDLESYEFQDLRNINVTQDAEFVIVTAESDIETIVY